MSSCNTQRYALSARNLVWFAHELGYPHLARRLLRHPGGLAARRLARHLAYKASQADHAPHARGPCRRTGEVDGRPITLLTSSDGDRHVIRSARLLPSAAVGEDAEALFDTVIG